MKADRRVNKFDGLENTFDPGPEQTGLAELAGSPEV